jgi:sugar phosphate isomerase/epimerase
MRVLRLESDRISENGAPWAVLSEDNLLLADAENRDHKMLGARNVLWSGWQGEDAFARDPRTWSPTAWKEFERACNGFSHRADMDAREILIRPHARHVLSDPQRCLTFVRRHEHHGLRLLLDPFSMLEASMLPRVEEHLARAFDALIEHERVVAVVMANVAAAEGDAPLRLVPIERGVIPFEILAGLAKRIPRSLPIVQLDDDHESQRKWLERTVS